MISVEQIHHLEARIERVLGTLAELRVANASLTAELQAANAAADESARKLEESERNRHAADQKLLDLEGKLSRLRSDQEEIEATINRTLHQLDELEGGLSEPPADPSAMEPEQTADEAVAVAADGPSEPTAGELILDPSLEQEEAAEEVQAAVADLPATAEDERPASREGAELDIF
jgi:chromosome segregation ATPase